MTTQRTTSSYPWDSLRRSNAPGKFTSRLVGTNENPRGKSVFWAMGWDGKPTLLIEYRCENWTPTNIPTFKSLLVEDHRDESCITLELLDSEFMDVFLKICLDIISALQNVIESHAREMCILRLERWCSLLQPSRNALSPEAQKGLIAELHLLSNDILPIFSEADALESWTGPSKAPKDFSFGQLSIEVKSKRGSSLTHIKISSEEQLNINETERLFLYVEELNGAPVTYPEAFSLSDVVGSVRAQIKSSLQRAVLDCHLASAGYFDEDDYSNSRWSLGERTYYEVKDGFPRIDSESCPPGVENVSYQIDLDYCHGYEIDKSAFLRILEQYSA